ncbi:MAG: M20/M25/M40 family metallo-hydrolase [Candidatus Eisenbacteria bacterium]|nr:M20/M25/M40 family metallo-hydrolase [Candidatus Eisenbacteria bacterium]
MVKARPRRLASLLCLAILALLAPPGHAADEPTPNQRATVPTPDQRAAVRQLIDEAARSDWGWERLRELCDTIGHRLAGSPAMKRAVDWSEKSMRDAGLVRVHREPATVPYWIRGPESARIVSPVDRSLAMLALGPSVPTPPGGLTASVVVVDSYEELDRLGRPGVEGRIVLFDREWTTYPAAAEIRSRGPAKAAALGAVAALVRSATPKSLDTPHTGWLSCPAGTPLIPAAAVSPEASSQIRRLVEAGHEVRVHLEMDHQVLGTTESHNVMGEVTGRELPEEIVLLGAHLDSWDVGQGAQDDGVGCLIMLEAARLIRNLPIPPRRTIRVVFFTDEEISLGGADSYLERHRDELPRHVAGFESDAGNEVANGFFVDIQGVAGTTDSTRTKADAQRLTHGVLAALAGFDWALEPLRANNFLPGDSGIDLSPAVALGMLGFGVNHPTEKYFDIHHSAADTFDKLDRLDMSRNVAIVATLVYLIADSPERLLPWPGPDGSGPGTR